MSNNLATIIIPTYNSENYVLKMLDSIYNQSYRPLELIIIDDNSNDNTKATIESWMRKSTDEKIHVQFIRNSLNKGLTYNINYGVSLAKGNYILFGDHDDIWNSEKVQKQINLLEENENIICCFTDRSLINCENVQFIDSEFELIGFEKSIVNFNDLCNYNARFSSNTICFRNFNFIGNIFPFNSNVIQHDFYIALMLSKYGDIGYIHIPLVKYRIHTNNLSGNYNSLISSNYKSFVKRRKYCYDLYKRIISIDKHIIENTFYVKFNEKINLNYHNNYKMKVKRYIPSCISYVFNEFRYRKIKNKFKN